MLPNKRNGKAIQAATLIKIYKHYKPYFAELLSRYDVPQQDKQGINELQRNGTPTSTDIPVLPTNTTQEKFLQMGK